MAQKKLYQARQIVNCPWCNKTAEDAAEDMVVHGPFSKLDHAYVNDCGWCDRLFTVKKLSDDQYEVEVSSCKVPGLR
jgi:hypothetical protein